MEKCLMCEKEMDEDKSNNRDGFNICSEECKDDYLDADDHDLQLLKDKYNK